MSDIDAQLAALENAAPLTEEPTDADIIVDVGGEPVGDPAAPADPAKKPEPVAAKEPLKPEELAQRYDSVKIALREERAQRRAERAALQAEQQKMEAAFQKFQEQYRQPQQQSQYRDQNQPFTYEDAVSEMWERQQQQDAWQQQQAAQTQRQQQQQDQRNREVQAIATTMSEYEADFREESPDYDDAVKHLTGAWDQQFEAMGYSPDQRKQIIDNLSINAVQVALQAGKDPAKAIYEAAQKVGYARQATPAAGAQKLAQMQAGAAAAKTLSGGGSGVQGEGLTLKQLAGLEGAAFDSAMEKLRKSAR